MKFDFQRIQKFSKNIRKGMRKFKGMRIPNAYGLKRPRRKYNLSQNFIRQIPNIATVLALCCGLTSVRFAYNGETKLAVLAILIAATLDLLDGRIARMLGASSEFGAELDSLSDFVSFGAAPVFIIYFFSLYTLGAWGWTFCLFFAVCSGLRLARFNIMTRAESTAGKGADAYFLGLPAPMAALIALLPYIAALAIEVNPRNVPVPIVLLAITLTGFGMISRIPTFSTKALKFSREKIPSIMLVSGLILAALFAAPWMVLTVAGILYMATIPITYRHFTAKNQRRRR